MALAIVTIFFGAFFCWFAFRTARESRRVRNWPTVPGRFLERGVAHRPGDLLPPDEPLRATFRYFPHVRYSYTVAGTEYVNDRLYLVARTSGSGEAMRRLVARLPDPVPVHYDPAAPARSYLLATPMWLVWLVGAVGAGALLLGLLQLLVALMDG